MCDLCTHLYLIEKNDAKKFYCFCLQLSNKDNIHTKQLEYITTDITDTGRLYIKVDFCIKLLKLMINLDPPKKTQETTTTKTIAKNKKGEKSQKKENTYQSDSDLPWTLAGSCTNGCLHRLYTIHRFGTCDWHIHRCLWKETQHLKFPA